DAEPLFLVDDDQPEVLELDVGAHQAMGADDDIDAPLGKPFEDASLLGGGAETADAFHDKGIFCETLTEGAKMLLGQDGGGHQDSDLPAVVDGLEGGAHGQLRLAVADIAAN